MATDPDPKGRISEYDLEEQKRESRFGVNYKWIALSNTTLGVLIATIDSSILIISLPAIFNGLGVNPLTSGNISLLLWLIIGYIITSSVTVVTIGRLSDMFGRVRLYNLGFLMFAVCSTLLWISTYLVHGNAGVISLIVIRLFQGLGGGFLFANSTAILTDAFPANERGKALGINQIMGVSGSLIGLVMGGILAAVDWHLVFLVSVPISVIGAIWAYIALRELALIKKNQKIDILGNVTFALSLTVLLFSLMYGLLPYGGSSVGWSNPLVIGGIVAGVLLMAAFVVIELNAKDPMFHLGLFRIRAFLLGITSLFLAGVARGGLQFMLIIWLQGIWLPLHGVNFIDTPLIAGIDMIPLILGFLVSGPIFGTLSDRYGARIFSTCGMLINVAGFTLLLFLPTNFNYLVFAPIIFLLGFGQGMFSAPNTASVMNSVPPELRGATSGMRATFMNTSFMFSLVIFFTLLVVGVSGHLQTALYSGLVSQNVSAVVATQVSTLPPTTALFAALLGYNPMKTLLPAGVLDNLSATNRDNLIGTSFFPNLILQPFANGLHIVFAAAAALSLIAAIASAMRGPRYINERQKGDRR
ncbi:MAG TPA: MFS transporter [Candidatus Saccharimonadales bacterium]|nr:MFS transporter [Candidatus Saccharimonadales bacterium]